MLIAAARRFFPNIERFRYRLAIIKRHMAHPAVPAGPDYRGLASALPDFRGKVRIFGRGGAGCFQKVLGREVLHRLKDSPPEV